MDFEVKKPKNREKINSKNHVFFECVFELIFERFWTGFGRVLGKA